MSNFECEPNPQATPFEATETCLNCLSTITIGKTIYVKGDEHYCSTDCVLESNGFVESVLEESWFK